MTFWKILFNVDYLSIQNAKLLRDMNSIDINMSKYIQNSFMFFTFCYHVA